MVAALGGLPRRGAFITALPTARANSRWSLGEKKWVSLAVVAVLRGLPRRGSFTTALLSTEDNCRSSSEDRWRHWRRACLPTVPRRRRSDWRRREGGDKALNLISSYLFGVDRVQRPWPLHSKQTTAHGHWLSSRPGQTDLQTQYGLVRFNRSLLWNLFSWLPKLRFKVTKNPLIILKRKSMDCELKSYRGLTRRISY